MMIIKNCIFTIFFPAIEDMRTYFFQLEDTLSDFKKPFTLIPSAAGAPSDTPVIIANTEYGHTQLVISKQSVQIVTNFDSNYWSDFEKCINYISNKRKRTIREFINILKVNFCFSGLIVNMEYHDINDPVTYIQNKFLKSESNLSARDVDFQVTYTYKDEYYIINKVRNLRGYTGEIQHQSIISLARLFEISNNLAVTLEINDRLAYNKDSNYVSSIEKSDTIFNTAKIIISEKMKRFIEKGEFNYE